MYVSADICAYVRQLFAVDGPFWWLRKYGNDLTVIKMWLAEHSIQIAIRIWIRQTKPKNVSQDTHRAKHTFTHIYMTPRLTTWPAAFILFQRCTKKLLKKKEFDSTQSSLFFRTLQTFLIANLCFFCCIGVILSQFTLCSTHTQARCPPASTHYHWLTHTRAIFGLTHANFLHRLKYKVFAELPTRLSLFPLIWSCICPLRPWYRYIHTYISFVSAFLLKVLHEK